MSITLTQAVFYVFSFLAVMSAVSVVISKNPVKAALFLVLTFFAMAVNWMLVEAEFLSIVLVLVYVGAVMVLFLFVVMMIDIESTGAMKPFVRFWPVSIAISCLLIGMMAWMVMQGGFGLDSVPAPAPKALEYSHVKALARLLYSDFLLPFELAGIILLVAMVAAIGLTFRGAQTPKTQRVHDQVSVKKADRLTVVKMPPQERLP